MLTLRNLFHSICPSVAIEAARILGLSQEDAAGLAKPFDLGCGFWRLPNNAVSPPSHHSRGLPQGLASSVLLSEVFLSVFLRKLHRCCDIDSVCYVDDLTLVATKRAELEKALVLLGEFARDFCLVTSPEKTRLWRSEIEQLTQIAAEWVLHEIDESSYAKEHKRIAECTIRLDRLAHLPAPMHVKAQTIVTGCTSLLAHSVSPLRKALNGVPLKVKRALSQVYAAPEVLYNILSSSTLDLMVTWSLTILRTFHFARKSDLGQKVLKNIKRMKKHSHSRFASLLRFFSSLGWEFDGTSLATKVGDVDLRKKWAWVREDYLVIAKKDAFACSGYFGVCG